MFSVTLAAASFTRLATFPSWSCVCNFSFHLATVERFKEPPPSPPIIPPRIAPAIPA